MTTRVLVPVATTLAGLLAAVAIVARWLSTEIDRACRWCES